MKIFLSALLLLIFTKGFTISNHEKVKKHRHQSYREETLEQFLQNNPDARLDSAGPGLLKYTFNDSARSAKDTTCQAKLEQGTAYFYKKMCLLREMKATGDYGCLISLISKATGAPDKCDNNMCLWTRDKTEIKLIAGAANHILLTMAFKTTDAQYSRFCKKEKKEKYTLTVKAH